LFWSSCGGSGGYSFVTGGLTAAEKDELLRLAEKIREGLGEVD
jgi:hypothetical protein